MLCNFDYISVYFDSLDLNINKITQTTNFDSDKSICSY